MKPYLKVILTLAIPVAALVAFALIPEDLEVLGERIQKPKFFSEEVVEVAEDSTSEIAQMEAEKPVEVDTTHKRILLFGDSMVDVLRKHFNNYCAQNGDTLFPVVWYSSGSKHWAQTDTLEHFINKFHPDYLMVCLCANELFVRDLDTREEYIKTIISKMQRQNLPFVWVCPPNWKKDKGITDLILKNVGASRFFDSRTLKLPRISDGAHPSKAGGVIWVDSLTTWLSSMQNSHPIRMEKPVKQYKPGSLTLLQPPKE